MQVSGWQQTASERVAIHPPTGHSAPTEAEVLIRPARAADAPAVQAFVRNLSAETRRKRFFGPIVELSPQQLERLTSCASADDLNLLAVNPCRKIVGMAQCVVTDHAEAEFALVVADEWQRHGIGAALCSVLFRHARARRLARLGGFVLTENWAMLRFAAKLGFSLVRDADATLTRAVIAFDAGLPAPDCERMANQERAGLAV